MTAGFETLLILVKFLSRFHRGRQTLVGDAERTAAFAEPIFYVLPDILDVGVPDALLFVGRQWLERSHDAHADAGGRLLGVPPWTKWYVGVGKFPLLLFRRLPRRTASGIGREKPASATDNAGKGFGWPLNYLLRIDRAGSVLLIGI